MDAEEYEDQDEIAEHRDLSNQLDGIRHMIGNVLGTGSDIFKQVDNALCYGDLKEKRAAIKAYDELPPHDKEAIEKTYIPNNN